MESSQGRMYESHAYVLAVSQPKAYLRDSRPRGDPIVQAVGESHFTLLELVPRGNTRFNPQDRVSIQKDSQTNIDHVKRRVFYEDLITESTAELPFVIELIVTKHEHKFVQFFNEAKPITTRMHSLQLLPGVGKTLMWALLDERKKAPFKNFEDIAARTKLQNPKKTITARIINELKEDVKRCVFVRPPKRTDDERRQWPG